MGNTPHFPKCPKFNHSLYPGRNFKDKDYWFRLHDEELRKHVAKVTGKSKVVRRYGSKRAATLREVSCSCGYTWWSVNPNWRRV